MNVLELLEDMESPNTKGKIWRKGQLLYDLAKDYAESLIESGKAKIWTPPTEPEKKETPKKRKQ